jgi:hypothetical protein
MKTAGELEMIAIDCEQCADEARRDGDEGLRRAWLSVAYRIRHAVKQAATPLLPSPHAPPQSKGEA